MIEQYAVGLLLSLIVAVGARWLRLLTCDGAVAATGIGTLVFGGGGWRPAILLVTFFVTSSALTRWHAVRKSQPEHGGRAGPRGRSGTQVLANGLVPAALATWYGLAPAPGIFVSLAGAIAASTADTWATEIGLLSSAPPRLITTGAIVSPGQSGGVTWLGTLGGVAGALLLAGTARVLLDLPFVAVGAAGTLAMMIDSLLGATVEGRRGMTNDTVNLVATATGASLAVLLRTL